MVLWSEILSARMRSRAIFARRGLAQRASSRQASLSVVDRKLVHRDLQANPRSEGAIVY
jgi:hypothetical protein